MGYSAVMIGMVLLHALFVMSEYAFVRAASTDGKLEITSSKVIANSDIFQNLEKYLLVCQAGKTIALLVAGIILGLELQYRIAETGLPITSAETMLLGLGFLAVVLVQTLLGFELPKRVAIGNSDFCTSWLSGFLRVSRCLLLPVTWMISQFK